MIMTKYYFTLTVMVFIKRYITLQSRLTFSNYVYGMFGSHAACISYTALEQIRFVAIYKPTPDRKTRYTMTSFYNEFAKLIPITT